MNATMYSDMSSADISTPEILSLFTEEFIYPSNNNDVPQIGDYSNGGMMSDLDTLSLSQIVNTHDIFGMDSSDNYHKPQIQQSCVPQFQTQQQQQFHLDNGYCSSTSSFPASPEPIMVPMSTYNISDMSASSPAESNDSGASFYNLEPVKNDQQDGSYYTEAIKTEPQDSCFPSMIDELNGQNVVMPQQVIAPMQYNGQYSAQNQQYETIDNTFVYSDNSFMPTTVSNMQPIHTTQITFQPQQTQQPQQQPPQQTQPILPIASTSTMPVISAPSILPVAVVGRKRSSTGAFVSTSGDSNINNTGSKKQRLTKRQKQQQMDKQVEEYTQRNKELRREIELLEKKVQFCTGFLQKYVSPIVQGRQNSQNWPE